MHRIKPFLAKSEAWFIENDLHIYFGALTIVVVGVLGWMLHSEVEKADLLRIQNVQLFSENIENERLISNLQNELANIKNYPPITPSAEVKPVVDTVDKISSKLNAKIEKVQTTLINSNVEPRIVTKTTTQIIENPVPADAELKTMMRQSFCTSFPEDKTCKVKK